MISWVVGMIIAIVTYRMGWWKRRLPEDLREAMSIRHNAKEASV